MFDPEINRKLINLLHIFTFFWDSFDEPIDRDKHQDMISVFIGKRASEAGVSGPPDKAS